MATKAKKKTSAKQKAASKVRPKKDAKTEGKRPTRPSTFRGISDSKRIEQMIEALRTEYPDAHCQLNFSNAFELLIATILSAQCTDVMVNKVTPELFEKYPNPQTFHAAPAEEIEKAIFKTGFYRNKTKSVKKACAMLLEKHNGVVPSTMEDLLDLGGVGRKTANCVLGNAFGTPGVVVDTHVKRLSYRMGYTSESNPDKIERDLMEIAPQEEWTLLSHLFGDHGRASCSARKPECDTCAVEHLCPKILD